MGEIVTVNFRGDELYGFKQDDGVFVALKPIVEAMGIDWNGQYQRTKRDPILSEGMCVMHIPFGRGGGQECVCLNVEVLTGFLFGIDSSRIKDEEVKRKVVLYQRECYSVLDAHFNGRRKPGVVTGTDEEPTPAKTDAEKLSHVREVRFTFDSYAARQLYFALGLMVVPAMIKPIQTELFSFNAIRHPDQDAA